MDLVVGALGGVLSGAYVEGRTHVRQYLTDVIGTEGFGVLRIFLIVVEMLGEGDDEDECFGVAVSGEVRVRFPEGSDEGRPSCPV